MGNICEECGKTFREEVTGHDYYIGINMSIDLCHHCAKKLGIMSVIFGEEK